MFFIAAMVQILQWLGYPTIQSFLSRNSSQKLKPLPTKTPQLSAALSEINRKYEKLKKLSVDAQVSYLENYIGKPVIVNPLMGNNFKERIYIDKLYLVQVITNADDKVLAYAVTTRAQNFNPQYEVSPQTFFNPPVYFEEQEFLAVGTPQILITLGESTFDDMGGRTQYYCYGFPGDDEYFPNYFQAYNYDARGKNLHYIVGINDAGYIDDPQNNHMLYWDKVNSSIDCNTVAETIQTSIINTYVVSRIPAGEYPSSFGVELDKIEVIN